MRFSCLTTMLRTGILIQGLFLEAKPALAQKEHEVTISPQLVRGFEGEEKEMNLLNRFGLAPSIQVSQLETTDPSELLKMLAPNLKDCELRRQKFAEASKKQSVHEYYEVYYNDTLVYNAYLSLHWYQGKLSMVRGRFPKHEMNIDLYTNMEVFSPPNDFLTSYLVRNRPLHKMDEVFDVIGILFSNGSEYRPAWLIDWFDGDRKLAEHVIVDIATGEWLEEETVGFNAARVFEKGPLDRDLIQVELEGLDGSGFLDGENFSVFAPSETDPRVYSQDLEFRFSPDDPNEAMDFNSVQSYYGATRALRWFKDKFDYDPEHYLVTVRVFPKGGLHGNNSAYLPPGFGGPIVELGFGDGVTYANLARDTDVIDHEFSHHVIFKYLKSSEGQTGALHEGLADYFAYAINEDPYLGESVKPGYGYLRTAMISEENRFDDPKNSDEPHAMGQLWSAFLWEVRSKIGPDMDQVAFSSLAYLAPRSGFKDALLGLLNADRDHYPLLSSDSEYKVFGIHKCEILKVAVARGLAQYLEQVEGNSCEMELTKLANESRQYTEAHREIKKKGKTLNLSLGNKPCAVILGEKAPGMQGMWGLFVLFLAPLLIAGFVFVNQRSKHYYDSTR